RAAAVFSGGRIVVVAEQQKLIARRSDLVGGRFDESKANIARLVFESVEIPRDATLRRRCDQHRAVRELIVLGIVGVMESNRIRERADRRLMSGQKMPAIGSAEAAVAF